MSFKNIKIDDYTYNLPNERIAKYPLSTRDSSNILVYEKQNIAHHKFNKLPEYFTDKDLLIFNNTKVIQARLFFKKITGAIIEIFCLEPDTPSDYEQNFQTTGVCRWKCIAGNLKKWKTGKIIHEVNIENINFRLFAEKISQTGNSLVIEFTWENSNFTFGNILENSGHTPIPPYLNRQSELSDKERYQTVYSKHKGSVAAPTAGLHFTENILSRIKANGADIENLTLHVGAGTFKPVKSETIEKHEMHTEHFFVTEHLIKKLITKLGNITAVGTTSVRTLESLYHIGLKILNKSNDFQKINQWEVYESNNSIDAITALRAISDYLEKSKTKTLNAETQIMIVPGYKFRVVNKIITNFHQPKSTLILLIAAFVGESWRSIYKYAIENDFRFLSYGDSSLLMP